MTFWIPMLLAALLAASLRQGSAEGDPLLPSLVDLVKNSPISSVDELKVLLQQETNAIEKDEEEDDTLTNHSLGRYIRSLVEAQPAQQAICKVRTEVIEVTRSMLDRHNVNFMLWPPCVEVQQCSGCCNSRLLQCVPTITSSRYLQVIKIQYINKKAQYDKAIISVEDHISCRCQAPSSSLSSSSPSSSSSVSSVRSSIQSNPMPAAVQQLPSTSHFSLTLPRPILPIAQKTHTTKVDLHNHNDLKHNQQYYYSAEHEAVARQWQRGTQFVHWTQPRLHQMPTHVHQPSSWPSEARPQHHIVESTQQVRHGSGSDGSRQENSVHFANSSGEVRHSDHPQRPHHSMQYNPGILENQELRTQYRLNTPKSDNPSPPTSPNQPPKLEQNPTPFIITYQKHSVTDQKNTEVTNHRQSDTTSQKEGNKGEEIGSTSNGDTVGAELASHRRDKESKLKGRDSHSIEMKRRRKTLETITRELDRETLLHPHHQQQRPTTFTTAISTVGPISVSDRQIPFAPVLARRREKHRKRISKAAIRAMVI